MTDSTRSFCAGFDDGERHGASESRELREFQSFCLREDLKEVGGVALQVVYSVAVLALLYCFI